MWIEYCEKTGCRRAFYVVQFPAGATDLLKPGQVTCPYCGSQDQRRSDALFVAHPLSPQEEAEYQTKRNDPRCDQVPTLE